jgi:hypothetical protein
MVGAQHGGPREGGEQMGRGGGMLEPLRLGARDGAEHRLAADPNEERARESAELRKRAEEFDVVMEELPEAEARVE